MIERVCLRLLVENFVELLANLLPLGICERPAGNHCYKRLL
jgi:hypothetical protein